MAVSGPAVERWRALFLILPEVLLTIAVLAGLGWTVAQFLRDGYLPQPFLWDPGDTFMDWFNPAYWANHEGIYSAWRSIYPPLTFAVLRIFSIPSCYVSSPFIGRDCDWLGLAALLAFHGLGMVLASLAFWRNDRRTALPRITAFVMGYPALFMLERGNVLILCFTTFVVAFGGVFSNPRLRALCIGLSINFKPYMIVPALAWAIKRSWRPLELAAVFTVIVYIVSFGLVGGGTPGDILTNTQYWVTFTSSDIVGELYYTTSFGSMISVLERGFPIYRYLGSKEVDLFIFWAAILIRGTQLVAIAALIGSWLQPSAASQARLCNLLLLVSLVSRSPGGYTEIFVVFLVFLEAWQGVGRITAIVTAYLIIIPTDLIVSKLPMITTTAWLSGQSVNAQFGIAIGQYLRPLGLLIILLSLSLSTLVAVVRAHRSQRPSLGLVELDHA